MRVISGPSSRETRFRTACRRWPIMLGLLSVLMQTGLGAAEGADVLTQHYNNAHTEATLDETVLDTTTVAPGKFERLWTLYADGQIVAQPLYVSDLTIDTTANPGASLVKGKFNTVIIATMHNTVYVYDADKQSQGPDGQSGVHRQPPVNIGVFSADPSQPCRPQTSFNPCLQKQRAALLLSNGVIYLGLGGDGNRGALFAFDAASLTQRAVWSTTPTGVYGGIWPSGQGPRPTPRGISIR